MLYKKNKEYSLSDELFLKPTSEYRGAPFWAWNCKLDAEELKRQIDVFNEMGLGGFHMHVRTGLETPYLSDEYMELVKECVEKAKENKMLAYLYDEDRWPSGSAGGITTKDEANRQKYLLFTTEKCTDEENFPSEDGRRGQSKRSGHAILITCFDIVLDDDGFLESYEQIGENDNASGTKWYVYRKIAWNNSWYNNQAYADTLNKKAIEEFIKVTHERYKEYLKDDFGKTVPSIFTDEPQFAAKDNLTDSFDKNDICLPWTDDFADTYKQAYNDDIIPHLPELLWQLKDNSVSVSRYRYHDHVAERFASAFADTVGKWCMDNNLMLTGHMMEEPTLRSQTRIVGDCMRSYRGFQLPGIDMLCNNYELTTAKQCQSAVHQYGREGAMSELYGVTNWEFDFRGHKTGGDWQAALGITLRVPHLSWVSMAGEAKRDYPASINYQSAWYSEYSIIENHFARVNTAMTRGKPQVRVGVIHPVESFWLYWGPNDKTLINRESMDENFLNITKWLLTGSVDFDFICESLLPSLCTEASNPLRIGEMEYSTIIVPGCVTLRSTTIDALEKFKVAGGKLIFAGITPTYENAVLSDRAGSLTAGATCISFDRASILGAVEDDRDVKICDRNGGLTGNLIYQMRNDNDCKWLFIAHSEFAHNDDVANMQEITIKLTGKFIPALYDTMSGEIKEPEYSYVGCSTIIKTVISYHDSLLYKLIPGEGTCTRKNDNFKYTGKIKIPAFVDYELSEPNTLVLDIARFNVDNGEYMDEDEILRLDNKARAILGLDKKHGDCVQPYIYPAEKPQHTIGLEFTVNSEIDVTGASLALEDPEVSEIRINGEKISNEVTGWHVDKAIKTVALPTLHKGENIIGITKPIGNRTNTERCYILGDFGVRLSGRNAVITQKTQKIAFSHLPTANLPFYGACVTYKIPVSSPSGKIKVTVPQYHGVLIKAFIDGNDVGNIVFSPYSLEIPLNDNEVHELGLKLYLSRSNEFGPIHNTIEGKGYYFGPNAWRTEDEEWSYEYVIRDTGIYSSPVIEY